MSYGTDYYRPRRAGKITLGILAGILAIVLAIGVTVAGYEFHWWMAKNNNNHNSQIFRSGYENQTTLRTKIYSDIDNIAALRREQKASASPSDYNGQITLNINTVCHEIDQLTGGTPNDISSFQAQECG